MREEESPGVREDESPGVREAESTDVREEWDGQQESPPPVLRKNLSYSIIFSYCISGYAKIL